MITTGEYKHKRLLARFVMPGRRKSRQVIEAVIPYITKGGQALQTARKDQNGT